MSAAEFRDFAHLLADIADELTMGAFGPRQPTATKSDGTWVTQVDTAVERRLRDEIAHHYPEHGFLGEEDGLTGQVDGPRWIVDPIDGTTNFAKGNPIFATLIAVQVNGVEVAGVASAPALSSRWDAALDQGARQDGRRMSVSDTADLSEAEVAFGGLSYFRSPPWEHVVDALSARTARQRGYGDFWQHCLVAAGSTDVALEADVKLWDLAAVKIIVEQAGGRFTDLQGQVTASGGSALSSNGLLHDEVLALISAGKAGEHAGA